MSAIGGSYPDMSDYVVHFTRDYDGCGAYSNVMSILCNRTVRAANAFGMARKEAWLGNSQKAACLSEVPLHHLKRLADKRSQYGLGFRKDFVAGLGGGPIMYAYKDTPHHQALASIMWAAKQGGKADDPFWKIAPFVDVPGTYPSGKYMFEWEREWRHVGDLKFQIENVEFLIVPEALHAQARTFFEDVYHEHSGPHYLCPYLDPFWSKAKVADALDQGTLPAAAPMQLPQWAR